MKKNKNIIKQNFSEEDVHNLINQYKNFFSDHNVYYELKTFILNYFQSLQKINEGLQLNYSTILLVIQEKIMQFMCEKIKQGDIDLEISIIDQYGKHSNAVKPHFEKLIINNAKKETYENYKQLTKIYNNLEKSFIDRLWEDSLIEAIETYKGNNTFAVEIMKNFKNKIDSVDKEFEQFAAKRQKVKTIYAKE